MMSSSSLSRFSHVSGFFTIALFSGIFFAAVINQVEGRTCYVCWEINGFPGNSSSQEAAERQFGQGFKTIFCKDPQETWLKPTCPTTYCQTVIGKSGTMRSCGIGAKVGCETNPLGETCLCNTDLCNGGDSSGDSSSGGKSGKDGSDQSGASSISVGGIFTLISVLVSGILFL